jgi:hypothetical protein
MSKKRGHRLIEVSREAVCEGLLHDSIGHTTDLPEDVKLEELWHHNKGWGYVLRVSSTTWESLKEGQEIPVVDVGYTKQSYSPNA